MGGRFATGLATALLALSWAGAASAQEGDAGWLIVADQGTGRLEVVGPDGTPAPLLPDGAEAPEALRGIAISPDLSLLAVVDAGAAAGEGEIVVVSADRSYERIATGLDFPEGVMWLDAETILFSSFTARTISSVPASGGPPEVIAELPNPPTGLAAVAVGGRTGVAVATFDGPAFLVHPVTGQAVPASDRLAGGGLLAVHPQLGVCVPEFDADRVRCFPTSGAPPRELGPVRTPVAVAVAGGRLIVTSPDGVFEAGADDGTLRLVTAALQNPAGVAGLGADPGGWAPLAGLPEATTTTAPAPATTATTAAPTTTTASTTTAPTTTAAPTTTTASTTIAPAAAPTTAPPVPSQDTGAPEADASRLPWGAFVAAGALLLALAGLTVARLRPRLAGRLYARDEPLPPPVAFEPINPDERAAGTRTALALAAGGECDRDAFREAYWSAHRALERLEAVAEEANAAGRREVAAAARRRIAGERADLDRAREDFDRRCPER